MRKMKSFWICDDIHPRSLWTNPNIDNLLRWPMGKCIYRFRLVWTQSNSLTRKPVGFMQSWNRTSHFKSHLLLIWNFQMKLEMRCAIWNFWNLSWKVAYLKLSDVTWNEMCYLKLFKPIMEGCLFETFRWDLKWDVLFEIFEIYHGGLLTWNFQMWLEMRCAIGNFWNLKLFNPSQGLLIWKFEMRLEMRYAIWNFWNLKLKTFQPITGVAHLKLSDETWNKICYLKLFKLFNLSQGLLIWNIWNVWNLKLFKHIMGVAYLKLSDETWKKMWYSKPLKLLKLFEEVTYLKLFETWNFTVDIFKLETLKYPLRTEKFQLPMNLEVINLLLHRVNICC